jgi:hypothetical protein
LIISRDIFHGSVPCGVNFNSDDRLSREMQVLRFGTLV